jgi:colanic acid/amylovoran biosynthesis protein
LNPPLSSSGVRVLVTNCVILNGGDASIALGILQQLRSVYGGELEVAFADTQPEVARRYYPELDLRPVLLRRFVATRGIHRRWVGVALRELNIARFVAAARWPALRRLLRPAERRELEAYESFDVIVSTGGTYLVETYPVWPRLAELRVGLALGKPLVMYTQSLGPFDVPYNRFWVRAIARRACAIFLRDGRSQNHLREIGADTTASMVIPDVAFALDMPSAPAAQPGDGPVVVVSARSWSDSDAMERYIAAMAQAIELLVARGFRVVLASSCQGIPEYVDDSVVAAAIADRLSVETRGAVTVDRAQRRPEELMSLLAQAQLAVCTRMHMAILSLNVGTPAVAVAYEFKSRELFEALGMPERVVDFAAIDGDALASAIAATLENPALPPAVAAMRNEARRTRDLLAGALSSAGT